MVCSLRFKMPNSCHTSKSDWHNIWTQTHSKCRLRLVRMIPVHVTPYSHIIHVQFMFESLMQPFSWLGGVLLSLLTGFL